MNIYRCNLEIFEHSFILEADEKGLIALRLGTLEQSDNHPLLEEGCQQLKGYFEGNRKGFTVPLNITGTPFQQLVYAYLQSIPYGDIRTYGKIAQDIGSPGAARAVGNACHRNPLPIFVPCHRVVGSGGTLVGFAYGLEMKKNLLDLESLDD